LPFALERERLTARLVRFTIHTMYHLEYTEGIEEDLENLRAIDRTRILSKVDEQLLHDPTAETRNKKILIGLKPPWQHEEPVRELRIGKLRCGRRKSTRDHSRASRETASQDDRGNAMKVIGMHEADFAQCVKEAQHQRVVLTRNGKPVAVLVGVKGMDLEQIELGHSDEFWELIRKRRKQKTVSRTELDRRLAKAE
jgi:prevent-host-death family protein